MRVETAHAVAVRSRVDGVGNEPAEEPVWLGVVRSPPAWFRRRVDEQRPELGVPAATQEALDRRRRDLRMQGLCAVGAHNAAWAELNVDARYRSEVAGDAADVISSLASRGRPVVLATDRQPGARCHREVLAALLRERVDES
jgi:hypothetical protein